MASLDVRPTLAAGGEPFDEIMRAIAALAPGEDLELIAPFEPMPLYDVLARRGFEHVARPLGDGAGFAVTFRRAGHA